MSSLRVSLKATREAMDDVSFPSQTCSVGKRGVKSRYACSLWLGELVWGASEREMRKQPGRWGRLHGGHGLEAWEGLERLKGRKRPLKTPGRKKDDEQNGEDKRVQNMLPPSQITIRLQTNGSQSRVPTECPKIVAGSIPTDRDRKYKKTPVWFLSMYDKNHYNIVK